MGKIMKAPVVKNSEIAKDIYAMELDYSDNEESPRPGQFVNVYLPRQDMLLPRPLSICRHVGGRLLLVYGIVGKGTGMLSLMRKGEALRISSPLGNGYDIEGVCEGETAMLFGGGLGVPPLLELARVLRFKGVNAEAVLGFREHAFLIDEMRDVCTVHVAVENPKKNRLAFSGNVIDLIRQKDLSADRYYACGPASMLLALTKYYLSFEKDVQVSLEERMGCGYGACLGCACKIREPEGKGVVYKRVCKDGPVFWGSEVIFDE